MLKRKREGISLRKLKVKVYLLLNQSSNHVNVFQLVVKLLLEGKFPNFQCLHFSMLINCFNYDNFSKYKTRSPSGVASN